MINKIIYPERGWIWEKNAKTTCWCCAEKHWRLRDYMRWLPVFHLWSFLLMKEWILIRIKTSAWRKRIETNIEMILCINQQQTVIIARSINTIYILQFIWMCVREKPTNNKSQWAMQNVIIQPCICCDIKNHVYLCVPAEWLEISIVAVLFRIGLFFIVRYFNSIYFCSLAALLRVEKEE